MYKKILIAADGSEHSLRAADHAVTVASANPAAVLEILYVFDAEHAKSDVIHHWNALDRGDIRKQRVAAVEAKAVQAGVSYVTRILHGEPGPAIVKYANENEADLIVLGSRGLNALQELVLGSVSHKVAKRANCPVMIVK
ncbi:universal stress protein [Paenibacillus tarimensis]|uniref:universal stress protein n=1 Tax=Paenibacillus tarimensis TaxID=416012 RepID=UPI001F251E4D|nr:universal stress protein [Paenibacillus tarimensis]MCF2945957.1 universal stress protein [Paenibacillus tarimensis]